jgi:hypothetical protein
MSPLRRLADHPPHRCGTTEFDPKAVIRIGRQGEVTLADRSEKPPFRTIGMKAQSQFGA